MLASLGRLNGTLARARYYATLHEQNVKEKKCYYDDSGGVYVVAGGLAALAAALWTTTTTKSAAAKEQEDERDVDVDVDVDAEIHERASAANVYDEFGALKAVKRKQCESERNSKSKSESELLLASCGRCHGLVQAEHWLAQRLEEVRGASDDERALWPRLYMANDRAFVRFRVNSDADYSELLSLVVGVLEYRNEKEAQLSQMPCVPAPPSTICQRSVGDWSCLEVRDERRGLAFVLARSMSDGSAMVCLEKSADAHCWRDDELQLAFALYVLGNRHLRESVDELHELGLRIYSPRADGGTVHWDDVAGYDDVKREVRDTVILALQHPNVYASIMSQTRASSTSTSTSPSSPSNGNRAKAVLFEGPPGVGKTQMARLIASSISVPLVYVPVESVMNKFYGESERSLAKIFDACERLGDAIIFIDEIDSLATSRGSDMHEATRRVLSVLLRRIEGFENSGGRTIVIGATNRKEDLDDALLSRFDVSIRFRLPSATERVAIFALYAKHLSAGELEQLAAATASMSGRDIRDICSHAERAHASSLIALGQTEHPTPPPLAQYTRSIEIRSS
jgi:ATPase family associated with various cellular activities (AAA)